MNTIDNHAACRCFCEIQNEACASIFVPLNIKYLNKISAHSMKWRDVRICFVTDEPPLSCKRVEPGFHHIPKC